ncbi:hypothetical protein ADICYQ_5722 [Cyclobacterium qasimii M12-11B]|uniref:Uncharacterized protein n=1 Tax=Cyclobacterium qasimii M12-11B TaxID=641524 RepID=S7WEJ2_9BACT|nr:hypothetical protein ADICYQ_5722 [Cyclobacterium qasimii M12-11B]
MWIEDFDAENSKPLIPSHISIALAFSVWIQLLGFCCF